MKNILSVVMLCLSLSACTSEIDSHVTQVGDMGAISITDLRSQLKNNLLVAQATLHNDDSSAVMGFYRCQFFDTNGMSLGQPQQWQPITVYPNEDQTLKCLSTQVEATNFKVEFSTDGANVSVQKAS